MKYPRKANGKINFTELSRITGVNASTLSTRYQRGLRGEDLLNGVPYKKRAGKKLILNGKEIPITARQEENMKNIRLHKNKIQQRLDEGWDFEDAIEYPPDYIKFGDLICLQVMRGKDEILIPSDSVDELVEMNVNITGLKKIITSNIRPLKKIFPKNVLVFKNCEVLGERFTNRLMKEDQLRKEIARQEADQRMRNKKPWLYDGTPQSVPASNWYLHLCKNNLIQKAVR